MSGKAFVPRLPVASHGPHRGEERCLVGVHGSGTVFFAAIATATEQEIGPHHPILSAMLPDGERVQIVLPTAVELGTISISIRRPSAWIKTLNEYETEGAFSRYVWAKAATLERRASELDPIE